MIVEKYIRSLLYEHDCVVIPDFGGFIAHYVSASVHPIRHTFVPPSKEIAFNEMLKLNDGVLISYVATGEGVTREEAATIVRTFTESIKSEIRRNQKFVFEEIGTLSLNVEQSLQFEPFHHINYLNESFGLPELIHKPIDRIPVMPRFRVKDRPAAAIPLAAEEKNTASEKSEVVFFPEPRRSRSKMSLLYAIGVPVVLGMASLTGYFWFMDNDKALSSFNPFHSYIEKRTVEEDELAADEPVSFDTRVTTQEKEPQSSADEAFTAPEPEVIPTDFNESKPAAVEKPLVQNETAQASLPEKPVAKQLAVKSKETKASTSPDIITEANVTPLYYVIVGGFGVKENAFKLKKQLTKKGFAEAVVIHPNGKGLHKVAAVTYNNVEEAAARANDLKNEYGSVWVFKF